VWRNFFATNYINLNKKIYRLLPPPEGEERGEGVSLYKKPDTDYVFQIGLPTVLSAIAKRRRLKSGGLNRISYPSLRCAEATADNLLRRVVDKLGKSLHRLEQLILGWAEQISMLPKHA
jgi:hypothetical protein